MTSQKGITQDGIRNKSHNTMAQINCTPESHETGHKWDDIMNKNGKSWSPGMRGNVIDGNGKLKSKSNNLLR